MDFIAPDNGGDEVFVHFSQVQIAGYKELKPDSVLVMSWKKVSAASLRHK